MRVSKVYHRTLRRFQINVTESCCLYTNIDFIIFHFGDPTDILSALIWPEINNLDMNNCAIAETAMIKIAVANFTHTDTHTHTQNFQRQVMPHFNSITVRHDGTWNQACDLNYSWW